MKILIDGESGEWKVFIEKSPESGIFDEVTRSECQRIAIRTDGGSVSFLRIEWDDFKQPPNDQFIDGEPPFISGHEPGQTCGGCETCWIKNPKFIGYLSHPGYVSQPNDQG